MRLTKARINKAIAHTGLRVHGNDDGYFYFLDADTGYMHGDCVMVPRLNRLSLDEWIEQAQRARESNIIEGMREDA